MHSKHQDIRLSAAGDILGNERKIAYAAMETAKNNKHVKVVSQSGDHFEEQFVDHIKRLDTGPECFKISEFQAR